jgi:type I restriction enzyme R subunit
LGRQYHLLTRDDRLETVAQDIVRHFLGRGFVGKAMVVSIDKATALRCTTRCGSTGRPRRRGCRRSWANCYDRRAEARPRSRRRRDAPGRTEAALEVLTTTDMALIVSPGQNEIEQMKKLGLDIEPHRKRMNESQPGWTRSSRTRPTRCGWCSSAPCG